MSSQLVVTNEPVATAGPQARPQRPSTAAGEALRVVDLSKSFRSGFLRRRLRGIEGVSFTVPRGCLFALLGHNGAGKTTTINCILDLVHAERGEVNILGAPNGDRGVRARVGYLPERPYFFEHLSGRELLRFYAKLVGIEPARREPHIRELVDKLGIASYVDRRLKKYSKGMLQRIGIAQALLGDPELLILDEPMSGLDPMGRREIRELLLELKARGKTIILSSHIVPDVEQVADTVAILREGRLVMTRDLQDLQSGSRFEVSYDDGERAVCTDATELAGVIARAQSAGRGVQRVVTHSTSLEDLYLEAHETSSGTPARPVKEVH